MKFLGEQTLNDLCCMHYRYEENVWVSAYIFIKAVEIWFRMKPVHLTPMVIRTERVMRVTLGPGNDAGDANWKGRVGHVDAKFRLV